MQSLNHRLGSLCLASALLGLARPAAAQTTQPPPAAPDATAELSEVVVTANKRAESQRDVPVEVTVFSGRQLEELHAESLEDVASRIPSMNLSTLGPGSNGMSLRGVNAGAEGSATVGFLRDEVPLGSSTQFVHSSVAPDPALFDMQSIEVLSGPQGTLYGASTLGGLVKYTSMSPDLTGNELRVQLESSLKAEGTSGYTGRLAVNYAVPALHSAIRLTAADITDSGFVDDPSRGQENVDKTRRQLYRAATLSKFTDDLTVELIASQDRLSRDGLSTVSRDASTGQAYQGQYDQHLELNQPSQVVVNMQVAKINWHTGWGLLTSITGHQSVGSHYVIDDTWNVGPTLGTGGAIPWAAVAPASLRKFTEELRFSGSYKDSLRFLAGAFYTDEGAEQGADLCDGGSYPAQCGFSAASVAELQSIPALGLGGIPASFLIGVPFAVLDSHDRYIDTALFGNLTWLITDRLDVTFGLRESRDRTGFVSTSGGLLAAQYQAQGISTTLQGSDGNYVTNFLVNPRFKLNDDTMFYARVANSYRPGGPNPGVVIAQLAGGETNQSFKPDKLISYEIGAKALLLGKRLNVDFAMYHIDWKDVQVLLSSSGVNLYENAGKAAVDGAEWSSQLRIIGGWSANASLSFDYARLTEDAPEVDAMKGDRLPDESKWTATLGTQYRFGLFGDADGHVGANYRYIGARKDGWEGSSLFPAWHMDPYSLLDLNAGVEYRGVKVDLFAKNLLNTFGESAAQLAPVDRSPGVPAQIGVIQPRIVGLTVAADWSL